jgi:hypothetical protein
LVMLVNLQAVGLWDATDDYHEYHNALAAPLPEDMQAGLSWKESTVNAWEAIQAMWMGRNKIKEANVDKLCA